MRLKLLRVSGNAISQIRRFGSTLLQDAYSDEKEIGFSISKIGTDSINGRFLEKKNRRIQVLAASGEPSFVDVPSISIVDFVLNAKYQYMVIHDLNGSIAPFISRLSSLSSYQFTAEVAEIPIAQWISYFEREGYAISVKEVTTSHVPFGEGIEATVRLRGDVAISTVTSGQVMDKKGDVTSAQLHCKSDSINFVFTWKNTWNYEIEPSSGDEDLLNSLFEFFVSTNASIG